MKNGDKPASPAKGVTYKLSGYPDRIDLEYPQDGTIRFPGLTKREYFAAKAMQGLCSNSFYAKIQADKGQESKTDYSMDHVLAVRSIEIADELLKQLEQ